MPNQQSRSIPAKRKTISPSLGCFPLELEDRVCPTYTFNLTFESPQAGSGNSVLTDFGHPFVPTADGEGGIELHGFHTPGKDKGVDQDLIDAGFGGTVFQSSPRHDEFGTGRIEIKGALGTLVQFHYGAQFEQDHPESGSITAYTFSRSLQEPKVPFALPDYENPSINTTAIPEDLFYQFALNRDQPVGPVTFDGPSSGSGYFNSFRWTSGTRFNDDPFSNTRPGAIQIDGVRLTVEPAIGMLRNSVHAVGLGATLEAHFLPRGMRGEVQLRDLAQALGVSHFNWRQTILVDWHTQDDG